MINVPKNKTNKIFVPSHKDADREKMLTRRALFKWSLIGGLIAFPVGLTVYRKLNDGSYQYRLKGPFQFQEKSYVYFDKKNWQGSIKNKTFIPGTTIMSWGSDGKTKYVDFDLIFDFAKNASDNILAEIVVTAEIKNQTSISQKTVWSTISEPITSKVYYQGMPPQATKKYDYVVGRLRLPFVSLTDLDFIKIHIKEIIQS